MGQQVRTEHWQSELALKECGENICWEAIVFCPTVVGGEGQASVGAEDGWESHFNFWWGLGTGLCEDLGSGFGVEAFGCGGA